MEESNSTPVDVTSWFVVVQQVVQPVVLQKGTGDISAQFHV